MKGTSGSMPFLERAMCHATFMSAISYIMISAVPVLSSSICITTRSATTTTSIMDDPYAETSTPLRESIRDKHEGTTITIQLLEFQTQYYQSKFRNFESLTGAKIKEVISTTATWYKDIKEDIQDRDPGFIDLYASFGNWIPEFVEMGGLKDLSNDINAVGLDWFDIMPAVRTGVATYKKNIYAVPLDGDVIIMLYRKDLVEDVGLPTPHTWDHVMEILDFYEGKDINGDGVPDYGNCFATAKNDITDKMFWAIASSFLQTHGTAQGTFFDPETMSPKSASSPKFIEVLNVWKKLSLHSHLRDNPEGVGWQTTRDAFLNKECVLFYNYIGPIKQIIGQQKAKNLTGTLDIRILPGMKCTDDEYCPHAMRTNDGISHNHAPFLASGGFSYAVNERVDLKKQAAALDFALYLSDPAVSFWDVANQNSFLDPLRRRHTASLANNETNEAKAFVSFGWEDRQLIQLKNVTEFNFLSSNYALDLRILGAEEYQERGTVEHLLGMCNGSKTVEDTADAITNSWDQVTKTYGLDSQRAMYRQTLGLAPYTEKRNITLQVIIPFAVAFVLLIAVVFKQRHTIKYKTRDVEKAPKSGNVALIFTDVEGSTALWDTSKTIMSKALDIHHNVIRSCIDKYGAYEVKTIGDAFMIAVGDAERAVKLANDIQLGLLNADWPSELAELPSSCVNYFPPFSINGVESPRRIMFKGLRVRVGIHLGTYSDSVEEGGEVQIMYDKVAKGYDYYGPVVNVAARIEHVAFGGQTLISSAVRSLLSEDTLTDCSLVAVGAMELRGVSEEMFLYQCLPKSLHGRKFAGDYRRRQSGGETMSSSDEDIIIKSMHLSEADLTLDVMEIDDITQLRKVSKRLQTRLAINKMRRSSRMTSSISNDTTTVLPTATTRRKSMTRMPPRGLSTVNISIGSGLNNLMAKDRIESTGNGLSDDDLSENCLSDDGLSADDAGLSYAEDDIYVADSKELGLKNEEMSSEMKRLLMSNMEKEEADS